MNDTFNKSLIAGHEGLRLTCYPDSRGFLTVGRGFNLDATNAAIICQRAGVLFAAVRMGHALTPAQADAIFAQQYATVAQQARGVFPKIDSYPESAAAVICDMIFELGLKGFLCFHHLIAALLAGDYPAAIAAIHDSALNSQVPGRVKNNISLLYALTVPATPYSSITKS